MLWELWEKVTTSFLQQKQGIKNLDEALHLLEFSRAEKVSELQRGYLMATNLQLLELPSASFIVSTD